MLGLESSIMQTKAMSSQKRKIADCAMLRSEKSKLIRGDSSPSSDCMVTSIFVAEHLSKRCKNNAVAIENIATRTSCARSDAEIAVVDSIEDVFLHISKFFVGMQSLDVSSLRNMNVVNKHWSRLVSSERFWRCVPKTSLTSSSHMETRLLGYINLGIKCSRQPSLTGLQTITYKAREKSTGKNFKLDVTSLNDDQSHPSDCLREIVVHNAVKEMKSDENNIFRDTKHLSLIHDWSSIDKKMLCWYEQEDETLESFMDINNDIFLERPELLKSTLFQILLGLSSLHRHHLVHRNLCAKNVVLFGIYNKNEKHSIPLVKIKNYTYCRGTNVLEADGSTLINMRWSSGAISATAHHTTTFDMTSFGELFCDMVSLDVRRVKSAEHKIGSNGVDLLQFLFSNTKKGITAVEALNHPYFAKSEPLRVNPRTSPIFELEMLRSMEKQIQTPRNDCVGSLQLGQWASLVDWLFEIASVFNKNTRTVFLALDYLQTCLTESSMSNKDLQLLAATCLFIASKYEDDKPIAARDLPFCADQIFDRNEIISMEHNVLRKLQWKLSRPTVYDFIMAHMRQLNIGKDSKWFWTALYISELALQAGILYSLEASVIAAASIMLAKYSLKGEIVGPKDSTTDSCSTFADLKGPIILLLSRIEANDSFHHLNIISKRYQKAARMNASSVRLIPVQTFDLIEGIYSCELIHIPEEGVEEK